jgi:hypothetical protein
LRAGLILAAAWLPGSWAAAQNVVAVLSSDSAAYREALAGFEEGYGRPVPTFTLSKNDLELPDSARVIVAFGGKAAAVHYPADRTLIYCLTPTFWLKPEPRSGRRVRIFVATQPEALQAKLKEVQPTLKRLAFFSVSRSAEVTQYQQDFIRAAQANGIETRIEQLSRADDLPDRLRSLIGKIDAFFMPPDPLLLTASAFGVAKEFGRSNNVPFYAPMDNLVEKGATASYASSFRENGRTAGRIAAKAEAGALGDIEAVYPDRYDLTINLTAAAQSGLTLPPDVLKKADRVIP